MDLPLLTAQHALQPSAAPSPRTTLTDTARAKLRGDIVSGRIPPGTRLRVKALSRGYGVSATPLREALSALAEEGLVIALSQRGYRTAPLSLDDLADITAGRQVIESAALRLAIAHGDAAWEGRLLAAFHRLEKRSEQQRAEDHESRDAMEDEHRAFHAALLEACPTRSLLRFHAQLYRQAERYRRAIVDYRVDMKAILAEHRAILDATLARDADRAAALLSEHLGVTLRILTAAKDGVDIVGSGSPPHARG